MSSTAARDELPLAGFTVAVTSDRRREGPSTLLEQYGARVVVAPAVRVVPATDETELKVATLSCVDDPPDVVVATTAAGLRDWLDAAHGWGLGDALRARLGAAYVVSTWSGAVTGLSELPGGVRGRRVAVQLPGEPQPELTTELRDAGALVVEVPVYRWASPADPAPLRRLVDLIGSRLVDAVLFTSAPAVGSLLRVAGPVAAEVLHALRTDVLATCVGPATAEALRRLGVSVAVPADARLASLVRILVDDLPRRAPTLRVAGTAVTLRGHAAVVDGTLKPLAPGPMAVLRALAASPGRVLSRAALLRSLPRGADEHAVEMAVARLRAALGGSAFVQTVVKRGYRLRVD
jgi:uroporphyrinogen-III synthase